MGFRSSLGAWLLGSEYNDYTEMQLAEGYVRTVLDDRVVQACENATRLTAYTASKCNVSVEGNLGGVWRDIVRPGRFMQVLVRDLLKTGNYVAEITDPPDLRRVSSFEVLGKRVLRYRLEFAMPEGQTTRTLPLEAVCHVMVNEDREMQWEGRSPFEGVELLAEVERGFLEQAAVSSKRLLSLPGVNSDTAPGDEGRYSQLLAEGLREPGYTLLQSKTYRGTDMPVQVTNLKLEVDQNVVELRRDLITQIYESVGIPPTLRGDAVPGQAYKTALSEWIDGHLQPMMDSIAEQLSAALECQIRFDMSPAKVPSVQDQAKIVAELTGASVPLAEAKQIAGL